MNNGHHRNVPIPTPSTVITIVGTPCNNGGGREYRVAEHPIDAMQFHYLNKEERIAGATARTRDIVSLADAFRTSKVFTSYLEADLEAWNLSSDLSHVVQVAELESSWADLIIQARDLSSQSLTSDACSSSTQPKQCSTTES